MEPSEEECRMRDLLHKTAAEGDLERLKEIAEAAAENIQLGLKRIFEILRHFDGRTALHSAAEAGQINVCQYLIEVVKLDVNIKDNAGFPPLFRAIRRRNLRTTTYLIDHGANVMLANRSGCTALHCAVETGSLEGSRSEEFMRLLISKGAVIDAKSVNGTPLELAIQTGMKKTVEILLEHKADPNLFVRHFTPLMLSVIGYRSECMDLLLKAGADQNMVSFGCTPLGVAAFVGNTVAIKHLLEAGANANAISMYGTTAVEDALLSKHYEKVKIFFPRASSHSDILKRTTGGMGKHICLEKALPQYGVALLETAALSKFNEAVGILFPRTSPIPGIQEWTIDGMRKHVRSKEALRQRELKWNEYLSLSKSKGKDCFERDDYKMAIYWYTEAISAAPFDIEVLLVLLSSRSLCYARLNEGGLAYVDAAYCLGLNPDWAEAYYRLAMALNLLEEYAASAFAFKKAMELNPEDAEVQTANREAAAWGLNESDMEAAAAASQRFSVVNFSVRGEINEHFLATAFIGNLDLLKKMLEAADLEGQGSKKIFERLHESEGSTPLHAAANGGKIYVCKYLIEDLKLDVNMKDRNGNSPLIHAIMGLQLPTTLYLIENGANLALEDDKGLTALHYAASIGFEEILQLLISKGAIVDAKSIEGTPLQCASGHGNEEVVKILLKHNADPNSFVQNFSPLILSVISESQECMDLLLEARANPDMVSCGATPLGAAVLLGNRVITRLLKAGANANATNWDGVTPLEMAALLNGENYEEVMTILFPMTRRIPSILEWPIDGIVKHVQSNAAMQQREIKRKEYFSSSKSKGLDFFKRNDDMKAVYWYTEAITADPSDATVLSYRSQSYARLNEGILALADAEACIKIKPDWAAGHYMAGVALRLLDKYDEAEVAYRHAVELDPHSVEIRNLIGMLLESLWL